MVTVTVKDGFKQSGTIWNDPEQSETVGPLKTKDLL
jgi:hypothetical protein